MDNYSEMLEEFSRLSEPLQKAIKEVIHESAGNTQKNMSSDEKQREVDKFFEQESVRRANWKRIHERHEMGGD